MHSYFVLEAILAINRAKASQKIQPKLAMELGCHNPLQADSPKIASPARFLEKK
jgi:hypothetical protein